MCVTFFLLEEGRTHMVMGTPKPFMRLYTRDPTLLLSQPKHGIFYALLHAYTSILVYLSTSALLSLLLLLLLLLLLFLLLLLLEFNDKVIIQDSLQSLDTPIARRNKRQANK